LAGQNLFIRILAVSDDYGVVPANLYILGKLTNPPKKIDLEKSLAEIIGAGLGFRFPYEGVDFFMFKRDRFDDYQSYLVAKRTRSEYLRLTSEEMKSEKFQEVLRTYSKNSKSVSASIESTKHEVQSIKHKEGDPASDSQPSSVREVFDYMSSLRSDLTKQILSQEAAAFFDHHETRNWIPKGATRKMVNWHAAVRTWFRKAVEFGKIQPAPKSVICPGCKAKMFANQYQAHAAGCDDLKKIVLGSAA
jgi:hypothetical protein